MSLAEREDMTEKEALNELKLQSCTLESMILYNRDFNGLVDDLSLATRKNAIDIAIKVLEKQMPKEWIAEYLGNGDDVWKCPCCNDLFMLMIGTPQENNYHYCPNCGQKLD